MPARKTDCHSHLPKHSQHPETDTTSVRRGGADAEWPFGIPGSYIPPTTGGKSIYINPTRIEGILSRDHNKAAPLLNELLAHATAPRFQYRHKWEPDDLVNWDNWCLLHKTNGDHDMSEVRRLYRVTLLDDLPMQPFTFGCCGDEPPPLLPAPVAASHNRPSRLDI
jgi:alpha-ketoglutarate-dependent taurine dioxygenase